MNKSPSICNFPMWLIISCMNYTTTRVTKTDLEKISIQNFYSPCCGSCGERIVIDQLKGKQYSLLINCKVEDEYSTLCTPMRLGTQKLVLEYEREKIISETYYKPVYDTNTLKKMFPLINKMEYYDSTLFSNPVLPLDGIDTLLINSFYRSSKKEGCSSQHLKLITGFILVKKETDKKDIYNKKEKFKLK